MHYNLSFRIGQYQFSSGIPFLLFTLFAVTLCASLSSWQWHRGGAANDRYLLQQEQNQNAAKTLPSHPEEYQKVKVVGSIEAYFLLDNRMSGGRAGREVLVDVKLDDASLPYANVLVNIGWQPMSIELVPVEALPETISIVGMTKTPSEGFLLQDPTLDPSWPTLLQGINLVQLGGFQGYDYSPVVVYSSTPLSNYILPKITFKNKYHKHLGYALQWILIGLACLILFIKNSTSRITNED